ncbi:MAG: hypothetical protein A2Z97_04290 [Bdellovibrionales bacterium GWB1_52_6]|nr:MAG: hypothetical protein A2Z97_04290 [Bdellovibrionales bacterium GWB1_52_6]OFZ04431.1 MAG: hypothetical protein A2X97_07240 [Bdellovibrionales bacterium GWA1_52_35]
MAATRKRIICLMLAGLTICGSACSVNNAKRNYVVAERLWNEGKYSAAVAEFDKVYNKDSTGPLGLQALYRSAHTQIFFLSQYSEAARKLKIYADITKPSPQNWEAQKLIGDLLFSKMDQYDLAVQHYRALLLQKPVATEAPEFHFRIGKSLFYAADFSGAIREYRALIHGHPKSKWAEKAAYEIGVTFFTRGEQRPDEKGPGTEAYQDAIDAYEDFLKKYPKSQWVPLARFGIASCLEEMDQLDAAYQSYAAIKGIYPSPNVIEIKLVRIRERKAQRSR